MVHIFQRQTPETPDPTKHIAYGQTKEQAETIASSLGIVGKPKDRRRVTKAPPNEYGIRHSRLSGGFIVSQTKQIQHTLEQYYLPGPNDDGAA